MERIRAYLREKIHGFVSWLNGPDCNVDTLARFQKQGTPFVVCDQDVDDFDFVGIDKDLRLGPETKSILYSSRTR